MQWIDSIPLFSIFLPMLAGLLVLPFKGSPNAWRIGMLLSLCIAGLSLLLLIDLYTNVRILHFSMGHVPSPWGNELRAGPLEALFALVYSTVFNLCLKNAKRDSIAEIAPAKRLYYYSALYMLFGSMLALIYTNDLFTAYVFMELSTIAACASIMAKDTTESLVETLRYLLLYIVGSTLFLLGVVLLYSVTGHLLMEPLQTAIVALFAKSAYPLTLTLAAGLLALGLAIKSAIFPFHSILPGAHGSAVATSSAILSALLLETYIFLLIKILCRVFTLEIAAEMHLLDGFLILGLTAMIAGSVAAMREHDMKRLLACSSAAQIGYIYVGVGLGSAAGLVAASFHIIAHALTKSMLFLCAGSLSEASGHSRDLAALRGAAWRRPLSGVGFTVGGASLIGIPLLACFISKLYLAQSAMGAGLRTLFILVALGLSMILNALYFLPAVIAIWSNRPREPVMAERNLRKSIPKTALHAITLFIALNILLGICWEPILACLKLGVELY